MKPSERRKIQWAEYMEKERQLEISGEKYIPNNEVIYSNCYSKETEDAIIDMAHGRQPKTKIMLDCLDEGEMFENVRKYGRKGIYMRTNTDKAFLEYLRDDSDTRGNNE
ncbi:hypothetical protein J6A31_05700 [bacterium]|nr:hypothetical protein [bacterium]